MSAEHWAKTEERGSITGIMMLLTVFRWLGPTVCKVFTAPVLLYFFIANGEARRNLSEYLQRHQSHFKRPIPKRFLRLRIFFNFGFAIIDRLTAWTGKSKRFKLNKTQAEVFLNLKDQNKGAVILVSHIGNFDISRVGAQRHKKARFNVFMHTKNAEKITRAIKKINPSYTTRIIQGDEINIQTALLLKEKVDAGEFVVIAADRVPVNNESGTVAVPFLGKDAPFPIGPYVIAKVLACPVISLFCTKGEDGFDVTFELFAEQVTFNKQNKTQQLQSYAAQYAALMEKQLQSTPLQWYNFHAFWGRK